MKEQTEQQARFSFASLKEKFLDALPYLVFFVLLFFTIYYLFGVADALLGIVFLFFSRAIIQDPGLSFANYLWRLCWFVLMGVCASIAGLNDVLFVIMSFCYLFFITLTQSDDYLPRNFYWLGLGYLFLLIYPITPGEILPRLAALGLSIALTTAFIYLMRIVLRKTGKLDEFARDRAFMREAFGDVAAQLRLLAQASATEPANSTNPAFTNDSPSATTGATEEPQPSAATLETQVEPERTFTLAQDYAQTEYATVMRQGGILSGRQCYTFALLLCCEQISDLIHATSKNAQSITSKNREYFADLAAVFEAVATKKITRISEIVSELEAFLERRGFDTTCYHESWNAILEALVRTLRDTRLSRDETTPFLKSIRYRYHFLRDNISLKNTQTRFSLQLATIVTIAVLADIALTHLIGLDFGDRSLHDPEHLQRRNATLNEEQHHRHARWHRDLRALCAFHSEPLSHANGRHAVLPGHTHEHQPNGLYHCWNTNGAHRTLFRRCVARHDARYPSRLCDHRSNLCGDGDLPLHAHAANHDHPHEDHRAGAYRWSLARADRSWHQTRPR